MSARAEDVPASADVSGDQLRAAVGHFATGVSVVTTLDAAGRPYGSTANALSSVSLHPPLVLVCLRDESETLAAALAGGTFAINVLRHDQRALADRFARRTDADTWRDVDHRPGAADGVPLLDDALATLECAVHDVADGGDHRIVIGRVVRVEHPDEHVDPLLFYRGGFQALEAPPAPPPRRESLEVALPSAFGDLRLIGVEDAAPHHASVVALVGEPRGTVGALAYIHLGCVLGDALGHVGCRRRSALRAAIRTMSEESGGVIVYHRDGDSPFGGCCIADASVAPRPASVVALAAVRRTIEQLGVHRARLLVDPSEPERLAPAALGLDVASIIELPREDS